MKENEFQEREKRKKKSKGKKHRRHKEMAPKVRTIGLSAPETSSVKGKAVKVVKVLKDGMNDSKKKMAVKKDVKNSKPGQKYATPPETDSLRIFYTSLLKQRPDSDMALKWCVERGILTEKKAQAALLTKEMTKLKVK